MEEHNSGHGDGGGAGTPWTETPAGRLRFHRRLAWTAAFLTRAIAVGVKPPSATAAGTVSTCNEAAFDSAIAGDGLVKFACNGTIVLSSTRLISRSLTVDGSGHDVTLSGGDGVQLFQVQSEATLTIRNLTISAGRAVWGGAINVAPSGALVVEHTTFSGNKASSGGAIQNEGIATIEGSVFIGNRALGELNPYQLFSAGGAINNYGNGTLLVRDSTFEGNAAPLAVGDHPGGLTGRGGAIHNSNIARIMSSTFVNNEGHDGGAIFSYGQELLILNSTLSDDVADFRGQEVFSLGRTTIISSTIVGRSKPTGDDRSAIAHYPFLLNPDFALKITNSIVTNAACVTNSRPHVVDGGGNVIGDCVGFSRSADPQLGPLEKNGGPTRTRAISNTSTAFNIGIRSACDAVSPDGAGGLDQRRAPRVTCSAGAFEPLPDLPHRRIVAALAGDR